MKTFSLSGTVKPFAGNGRKFGYPTANIEIDLATQEGLFVGYVEMNKTDYPALIFIGTPITLEDEVKRAEAHILDFEDRDLYGEQVVFRVTKKLRNNHDFGDLDALIEQMHIDEGVAREYFKEAI